VRIVRPTNLIIIDLINLIIFIEGPIPVAARSKAWVCGRTLAGIACLNPAGGMDVCFECCVLSGRGLCDGPITLPEESYKLWCVVLCSWSPDHEEAMAHQGMSSHEREYNEISKCVHHILSFCFFSLRYSSLCNCASFSELCCTKDAYSLYLKCGKFWGPQPSYADSSLSPALFYTSDLYTFIDTSPEHW
jgi:hypothetical protein